MTHVRLRDKTKENLDKLQVRISNEKGKKVSINDIIDEYIDSLKPSDVLMDDKLIDAQVHFNNYIESIGLKTGSHNDIIPLFGSLLKFASKDENIYSFRIIKNMIKECYNKIDNEKEGK